MTGAGELLDQLDAARAAATPGPWAQHSADDQYVLGQYVSDDEYLDVADTYSFRSESSSANAALIVAAVNHLPQLTAALRAVLLLADELDGDAKRHDDAEPVDERGLHASIAAARVSRNAADRLRTAIASALTHPTNQEGATK